MRCDYIFFLPVEEHCQHAEIHRRQVEMHYIALLLPYGSVEPVKGGGGKLPQTKVDDFHARRNIILIEAEIP